MAAQTIVELIHQKLGEQIERTEHLVQLVPANSIEWKPVIPAGSSDLGHLLGHLLECMAGFCALFYSAFPQQLADLVELRRLPVNHGCGREEALKRIREYAMHIDRGFALCTDADLSRALPTVFVPEGEPLLTLLLGNLEHLINHKYQLFFYLKLHGLALGTRDIYHWRGANE